jgi:hypothetical protein
MSELTSRSNGVAPPSIRFKVAVFTRDLRRYLHCNVDDLPIDQLGSRGKRLQIAGTCQKLPGVSSGLKISLARAGRKAALLHGRAVIGNRRQRVEFREGSWGEADI